MRFESHELDESGRTLRNSFLEEYRAWFAGYAPAGVTPDDHGVDWNSWLARPWRTEEYLHPTAWTMSRALAFLVVHIQAINRAIEARPSSRFSSPSAKSARIRRGSRTG